MRTIVSSLRSVEDIKLEIANNVGNDIHIIETNKQGKQIKEYTGAILDKNDTLCVVGVRLPGGQTYRRAFSYNELLTREFSYQFPAVEVEQEL